MVATIAWLRDGLPGPVTGRTGGAGSRDIALCELCSAESLFDDGGPAPPVREVCQQLGVAFWPTLAVEAEYARGVWLSLRWALGEIARPPLDLPLRRADGAVMVSMEIYAELLRRDGGAMDAVRRAKAASAAEGLATDSRMLAALVEDTAARIRS